MVYNFSMSIPGTNNLNSKSWRVVQVEQRHVTITLLHIICKQLHTHYSHSPFLQGMHHSKQQIERDNDSKHKKV